MVSGLARAYAFAEGLGCSELSISPEAKEGATLSRTVDTGRGSHASSLCETFLQFFDLEVIPSSRSWRCRTVVSPRDLSVCGVVIQAPFGGLEMNPGSSIIFECIPSALLSLVTFEAPALFTLFSWLAHSALTDENLRQPRAQGRRTRS